MKVSLLANVPLNPNQGSGYVICGYANAMRDLGHSVSLHTAFPNRPLPGGKGTQFRTRMGMLRSLSLAAKSDLLLLWGGEAGWVAPRIKALRKRGVVIASSNGLDTHYLQAHGASAEEVAQHPSNPCFRDLDGLFMVSQFDADFAAVQNYQPAERRLAIPNPLPDEFIGRSTQKGNSNLVLFVGNWLPNKGSSSITEMIQQVSIRHSSARFRLIGPETSQVTRELDLTCVEAIDPGVSRADLIRHYEEASILVMPSRYESFGMVASEAMACGCAVIATKTGFPYELQPEEEVLHVPFGDSKALGDAVIRLLEDDELRDRISQSGHRRVQNLTWESSGRSMNAFITGISVLGRKE